MDIRLRIIIGILLIMAFVIILHKIKAKKIDIRHSLAWFFVWIILIVIDIFPEILIGLTELFGFSIPVNMLFFIAICFIAMIIFGLSVKVSMMAEQNRKLTQEIALLNKRIEETFKTKD